MLFLAAQAENLTVDERSACNCLNDRGKNCVLFQVSLHIMGVKNNNKDYGNILFDKGAIVPFMNLENYLAINASFISGLITLEFSRLGGEKAVAEFLGFDP